MTKKSTLEAALVGLRRERGQEEVKEEKTSSPRRGRPPGGTKKEVEEATPMVFREERVAFTSRIKPSQRRWAKQWLFEVEEEKGRRYTIEDVLESLFDELQASEALRVRVLSRARRRD